MRDKDFQEGDRIEVRTESGKLHGTIIDNLSMMYFIEMDNGDELFINKKGSSIHKDAPK
jgi:hypothetical protein